MCDLGAKTHTAAFTALCCIPRQIVGCIKWCMSQCVWFEGEFVEGADRQSRGVNWFLPKCRKSEQLIYRLITGKPGVKWSHRQEMTDSENRNYQTDHMAVATSTWLYLMWMLVCLHVVQSDTGYDKGLRSGDSILMNGTAGFHWAKVIIIPKRQYVILPSW